MKHFTKHPEIADLSVKINIGFLLLLIVFLLLWVVGS